MTLEEPSSPQESSATQIIEDVIGNLKLEGFELAVVPLKIDEQASTSVDVVEEVLKDKGSRWRIGGGRDKQWGRGGVPDGT